MSSGSRTHQPIGKTGIATPESPKQIDRCLDLALESEALPAVLCLTHHCEKGNRNH